MKVLYKGDFTSPSGYSRAARAHCKALIEAGVDVIIENMKHDTTTIAFDEFWQEEYPKRSVRTDRAEVVLWHHTPEFYQPSPAQLNIGMVAWETSLLPMTDNPDVRHNWVKQLNRMQAVWTFCSYAKKAMEDSGVTVPIEVIPHPMDPEIYSPVEDAEDFYDAARRPLGDDWFKFVSIFQWTPRKDPFALIMAYLAEFKEDEKVALILKTYVGTAGDLGPIKAQMQRFRKGVRLAHKQARIFLVPGLLSDDEIAETLRSSDCFVTTSRGEGFCLPAVESMACGTPVIAPKGSSFTDFITEQNGYLVKCHQEPVYGMPHIPWYYSTQDWHRTDVKDLQRRMREAYTNREALQDRSKQSIKASRQFHPTAVAKRMCQAIESLVATAGRASTKARSSAS